MSRIGAYCLIATYLAVQAVIYFNENTLATGSRAASFLVLATLSLGLGVASLTYLAGERSGRTVGRRPTRWAWAGGTLLLVALRMEQAFIRNQETIGWESQLSALGFIVSLAVGYLVLLVVQPPALPAGSKAPVRAAPAADRIGKYEIRGVLGRGAMGTVHDGWDPAIGRRVAIKTIQLHDDATDNDETDLGGLNSAARFRREAQAAGRLLHPNIVSVFDYGEIEGTAHIVMEFVDGQTLSSWLSTQRRPPLADVMRIMYDVLIGLAYCHELALIHRDIKPANIMLTRNGRAKIADFGIARLDGGNHTRTGMIAGTAAYMSPEQFRGDPIDARSDLYSCGVLLYLMLTGERPFNGSGITEIMAKVLSAEVPSPSERFNVPPAFDAVVRRAMAKEPADRFPSAIAFASALRGVDIPDADDATRVIKPTPGG